MFSKSRKHNTEKRGRYSDLGKSLFVYRENHGLTLTALASQFNVTYVTIRNWEQGRIPIRALPLIRKFLSVENGQ